MRTSLQQRLQHMEDNLHQSGFDQQGVHREVSVNKIIIVYMHCVMGDGSILMFIGGLKFLFTWLEKDWLTFSLQCT